MGAVAKQSVNNMGPRLRTCGTVLLAMMGLFICFMLPGTQAQQSSITNCINDPAKETGCELAITRNLVLNVIADVAAAKDPFEVYTKLNNKDPRYVFNGFYTFVYDSKGIRVAHVNTSSLGLELQDSNDDIGVPTYPNFAENVRAIARAGGGTTEYLFTGAGGRLGLKKSYIGPELPNGYSVGAGYTEISSCLYTNYTFCSPVAAYALSTNLATGLEYAPNPQTLIDAVNRQVYPGTIPGGFYTQIYDGNPATGYVCMAHGAVIEKAGKTPQESEAPDVAAALTSAFEQGIAQYVGYLLNGRVKYTWLQPVESVVTGRKYFVLAGYLTDSSPVRNADDSLSLPACHSDPVKETGCEYAAMVNLVNLVVADVNAASDPRKVYEAINSNDPRYQANGFYPLVLDVNFHRVAYPNATGIGNSATKGLSAARIPVYTNFREVTLELGKSGGGTYEYIFVGKTDLGLKRSIAKALTSSSRFCTPVVAYTLASNFGRILRYAGTVQPLLDAANQEVYPGRTLGGFYVTVYDADPATGFRCLAHGDVFAKAGKTPLESETPDVAAALLTAFAEGAPKYIYYVLNGANKYTWLEPVQQPATGKKFFILSGYLTGPSF
ncbi:hypothetical protein KFL_000610080 [Klebsormidium nitens]|uniref:Uncharacterized protein n=1 Tax=Klebsormidium nitens TaxID=105231 RepID=A0A0U9HIG3_KLENI|nr:hypothetical protein KFL_000610080 [Klebsormidium nitens]|eukprot:GAQ80730.1 hypothetical protein KFL_000610080 [Klebsormidium nitens]